MSNQQSLTMTIHAADLFCGAGGTSLVFNRENNRIEINAQIRTRDGAALKIFEPTDK